MRARYELRYQSHGPEHEPGGDGGLLQPLLSDGVHCLRHSLADVAQYVRDGSADLIQRQLFMVAALHADEGTGDAKAGRIPFDDDHRRSTGAGIVFLHVDEDGEKVRRGPVGHVGLYAGNDQLLTISMGPGRSLGSIGPARFRERKRRGPFPSDQRLQKTLASLSSCGSQGPQPETKDELCQARVALCEGLSNDHERQGTGFEAAYLRRQRRAVKAARLGVFSDSSADLVGDRGVWVAVEPFIHWSKLFLDEGLDPRLQLLKLRR